MPDTNTLKQSFQNLYIESGKLISEIRESYGDSIDSAAQKLGIDPLLLSAIESGQSVIDIDVMDKLHEIYNVDVKDFNVRLNERISEQDAARLVVGTVASFDRLSKKVREEGLSEKYGAGVGFMLKDIRAALNKSVQEVARDAGVKEIYVYKLEAGEFDLRYISDRIYRAYGISKEEVTIRLDFSTRALFLVADTEDKIDLIEEGLA